MKSGWSRWAGMLTALLLAGCGVFYKVPYSEWSSHDRHIKGFVEQETVARKAEMRALLNSVHLEYYRRQESPYYRVRDRAPQQCLALSGGGIRSAAFSIGVLKALHEKRRLSEIDIISSVSGGSYAASWFYVQQGSSAGRGDRLFAESSLTYLGDNARLVSAPSVARAIQSVFSWLAYFFDSLANGLFFLGTEYSYVDGSSAQFEYEAAIRRTFFSSPEGAMPNPHIGQIAPLITEYRLPFLIINATIGKEGGNETPDWAFSKRIFEFTPIRIGADSVGYFTVTPTDGETTDPKDHSLRKLSLSRVVRISGAAIDAMRTQNVAGRALAQLVEFDLGAKVELRDSAQYAFIYLSDGGFADNLGAYSLIRRRCEEIIISDAEFDPSYEFGAYRKLQEALSKEMHVTLAIKDIDEPLSRHQHRLSSDCPATPAFDGSRPVMRGSIRSFPGLESFTSSAIVEHPIDVVYVKLSLDHKEFDDVLVRHTANRSALETKYSPHVVNWYASRKQTSGACAPDFPQLSTVHQNFSPAQFRAYVDLGYKTVLNDWALFDPSSRFSRR